MTILADDPTAAAVLATVPSYPVPPSGRSPAIDGLRAARAGHGLAIGRDGVMMILRRAWLALDVLVAPPFGAHLPYGSVGPERADLLCGLIPRVLLSATLDHFDDALPNEAAAFIIWHEATGAFSIEYPVIDHATPSRLVYRTPALPAGAHLVCDIHSHGRGAAFFSSIDDTDDAHSTKVAMVFGNLDDPEGPSIAIRLCAGGMFLPLPSIPFARSDDAA